MQTLYKCYLNKPIEECKAFNKLDVDWEFVFKNPKFTAKARERRRLRGTNKFPKIFRLVRILSKISENELRNCIDIEWYEKEIEDEPLYNPTDPDGLSYAWTKMVLTHATNTTAFDTEKGDGIVIGIIGSGGSNGGLHYIDNELGGTGNQANDWAAIQAGTHAKVVNYTNPLGVSIDPYGGTSTHEDVVGKHAVAVMDNAEAYCGSCPNAKVMAAIGQNFDQAIQRMADLGVDIISVSYSNCYGHRTAIQYATAAGVVVVYAHGSNTHGSLSYPLLFEAVTVGGFSLTDVSDKSYGVGLTVVGRGVTSSAESYATPTVAGICGLIIALNPTWNVGDIYSALITACQKPAEMSGDNWHIQYGWGIPNALASLSLVLNDLGPLVPCAYDVAYALSTGAINTWTELPTTNFDHVEVYRNANTHPILPTTGTLIYTGTGSSYTDSYPVLNPGTWCYHIIAIDSNAKVSDYILPVKKTIVSIAPSISVSNIGINTCDVTCDTVYNATVYTFRVGRTQGIYTKEVVSATNSASFSGLLHDTTYYVIAIASTPDGDVETDEIQFTTLRGPYMPLRIPAMTQIEAKFWQVLQAPCAVRIGAITSANPSGINATLASVGLTDSGIELSFNIETSPLGSDQMHMPYDTFELSWEVQAVLSLDQANIWNLALGMSYDQDAVSGSSMLTYNAQLPSPYRCVRIESEGAKNDVDDAPVTEYTDFWKSKINFSGAIAHGRTVKTTLPMIIRAVANADDEVGATLLSAAIDRPYYESYPIFILHLSWTGDASISTSVGAGFRLLYIALNLDSGSLDDIVVSLDAGLGSDYDVTLHTFTSGNSDYFYRFNEGAVFESNDEIIVSGDVGAGNNCYCTIGYAVIF